MVNSIDLVLEGNTLLTYKTENGKYDIKFSDIKKYWDYADPEEIEGCRAYLREDKKVILILLVVAQGQGGVVIAWNSDSNSLEHISEASYSVAVDMDANYIYMLQMVCNWNTRAHFEFARIEYGVMDARKEPDFYSNVTFDKVNEFTGDYDDIDLFVNGAGCTVRLKDKTYKVLLSSDGDSEE